MVLRRLAPSSKRSVFLAMTATKARRRRGRGSPRRKARSRATTEKLTPARNLKSWYVRAGEADEEDEEVPFGYAAMSDDDDGAREEETEGLSFLA